VFDQAKPAVVITLIQDPLQGILEVRILGSTEVRICLKNPGSANYGHLRPFVDFFSLWGWKVSLETFIHASYDRGDNLSVLRA
jgi:hypothetical protein